MTCAPIDVDDGYEQKWSRLNRNMRWEVAELLRDRYLESANRVGFHVSPPDSFYARYGKRAIDVVVSAAALGATLPLNVGIAIATAATLGRPIFFTQQRLGKDGEPFTLVKFRNMREAFDENGHPLPGALRVTKLGKFMRRTSLDELLNFWSILKGDMSLIGPRPLVPEYGARYSERHRRRMLVRPGLECPSRSREVVIDSYDAQFENDIWYVENVSLSTDIRLVGRLAFSVMDRRSTKRRATASKGAFLGYGEDGAIVTSHTAPLWAVDEVLRRHGFLTSQDIGAGSE